MFKLDEKDRGAKEKVLQDIMELMGKTSAGRLKDLKKPGVAEVSVTALKPKDDDDDSDVPELDDDAPETDEGADSDVPELPGMGDEGDDEPSDDEKAKIAALYHKYCK